MAPQTLTPPDASRTIPAASARTTHSLVSRGRLSPRASLFLLASIVVSFLAASSSPTPLYEVYQREWGFSPITTTVVFGVYAVAVLTALLTVGRLSDHAGRRPVLLAAIAVQAASMVLFTLAGGVPALLLARVVQGLSAGAALGAVGAGLLDVNPVRGTLLNAVSPPVGTATGGLVAGVVVDLLPWPTHLVFAAILGVLALQAVGVILLSETATRTRGAWQSLRPEVRLPRDVRGPFLVALPVLVAVWALAGFYGSLAPELLGRLVGSDSVIYGGLGLFILAGAGALSVLALRGLSPQRVMVTGVVALLAGLGVTLASIDAESALGFVIGTAVAGVGFGAGFQGSVRTVVPLATSHERSGVLSLLYTASYLAMGVPAVIAGVLVVHGGGLIATAEEYGIALMALAGLTLVGLVRDTRRAARPGTADERGARAHTPHPMIESGCPSAVS